MSVGFSFLFFSFVFYFTIGTLGQCKARQFRFCESMAIMYNPLL